MKFLFFYKGRYLPSLTAPEIRNVRVAKELIEGGHEVSFCALSASDSVLPAGSKFFSFFSFRELTKELFSSDVVVLHGGGPILLFLVWFSGVFGKRIVLDAYAPRWIELEVCSQKNVHLLQSVIQQALAFFNAFRTLFGVLIFDMVIVANSRQQDLLRGMQAPFSLSDDFSRIKIIPFGCDSPDVINELNGRRLLSQLSDDQLSEDDFLIGWLGGVYEWFDFNELLKAIAPALENEKKIKIIFFGVAEITRMSFLLNLPKELRSQLVFLPWVDFHQRFDYWCGLDLALVWGNSGPENDYASRTRNFDCLSLGLPIIQNRDDEWAPRLEKFGAGKITELSSISQDILRLARTPEQLSHMSDAMFSLATHFYWSVFSRKLLDGVAPPRMSLACRLWKSFVFVSITPVLVLVGVVSSLVRLVDKK